MKKILLSWVVWGLLLAQPALATNLCTVSITTALTGSAQTAVSGFGKPQALSASAAFTYVASSATSVDVYLQTSVDGGTTWYDIGEFQFTTASASKYNNVTGLTAVTTPVALTDGSLTTNTAINGLLGDRFRCKITSIGTYGTGTSITVNIFAR